MRPLPTLVAWSVTFLAVIGFSGTLWSLLLKARTADWEVAALSLIRTIESNGMTSTVTAVTSLGSPMVVAVVSAIVAAIMAVKHNWTSVYRIGAMTVGTTLMNQIMKDLFERPRPVTPPPLTMESGFSFPSGHAMIAMCFYGYLLTIVRRAGMRTTYRRLVEFSLVFIIFSIGFSRLYLGVHYPTDVIGGFAAGLAWLVFGLSCYGPCVRK